MNKKTLSGLVFIILILLGAFLFYKTIYKSQQTSEQKPSVSANQQSEKAKVVSTKPDPLNNAIVSGTEVIEITFNYPLQNIGEFKLRIEPEIDVEVKLSSDRKTAIITPKEPYELGRGYTIYIGPDTKFDDMPNLGETVSYHFQTIKFRGI